MVTRDEGRGIEGRILNGPFSCWGTRNVRMVETGGKTKRLNASDLSNRVPFLPFRMRKWKKCFLFFFFSLCFNFFFFFFFSFFVGITNADLIATRSRLVESSYEAGNETLAILRSGWPEFLPLLETDHPLYRVGEQRYQGFVRRA